MRRVAAVAGLVALASIIVPLLAAAQAPGPILQVKVAADPAADTVRKSHGSVTFQFTVSFTCNGGTCTGNQFGEQNVQVSVTETKTSSYPAGWEVKVDSPSTFMMKAKETHVIPVIVHLLDDNPDKSHFPIGLDVKAQPQPTGNTLLDPLVQQQLQQSSAAGATVNVDKILTTGEQITSWARSYRWPLLGAAAVLLVAGVVLVERKRTVVHGLALSSETPVQSVAAGRGASFPVFVANDSKGDDRVALTVAGLPHEWSHILPLSELDLRPGERTQMWLTVRAPGSAWAGQSYEFRLHARSLRTNREAELPLQVSVVEAADRPTEAAVPPPPPPPPPIEFEADAPADRPARARPKRRSG